MSETYETYLLNIIQDFLLDIGLYQGLDDDLEYLYELKTNLSLISYIEILDNITESNGFSLDEEKLAKYFIKLILDTYKYR